MSPAETHRHAAEIALDDATRNPVMSSDQAFRAAEVHALLAIEARLGQLVDAKGLPTDIFANR